MPTTPSASRPLSTVSTHASRIRRSRPPTPYFASRRQRPLSRGLGADAQRPALRTGALVPEHLDPRGGDRNLTEIYVDGDACPVREEIYRVAARLRLGVLVVSNGSRPIRPPRT